MNNVQHSQSDKQQQSDKMIIKWQIRQVRCNTHKLMSRDRARERSAYSREDKQEEALTSWQGKRQSSVNSEWEE